MDNNCNSCKSDNLKVKSIYIKRIDESDDMFKKVDLEDASKESLEHSINFTIKSGDMPEGNKKLLDLINKKKASFLTIEELKEIK